MTTFIPKPLPTTTLKYGLTSDIDGVGGILYEPRISAGSTSTVASDRIIQVSSVPASVVISTTDIQTSGYRAIIKDVSGNASNTTPIFVLAQTGFIDGNSTPALVITEPYASVEVYSDGIGIYAVPSRASTLSSPALQFSVDLNTSPEVLILRLPVLTGSADEIRLRFNRDNASPYIFCTGSGAATMHFSFRASNALDDVRIIPDTSPVAISTTPVYFSTDGTAATSFDFTDANSHGQLSFSIEGTATTPMERRRVDLDILSIGTTGTPNFFPLVHLNGSIRSATLLEED
jgi:hypothetical protein